MKFRKRIPASLTDQFVEFYLKRITVEPKPRYLIDRRFVSRLLCRCILVRAKAFTNIKDILAKPLDFYTRTAEIDASCHMLWGGARTSLKGRPSYGQVRIPKRLLTKEQRKRKRHIVTTHKLFYDSFVGPCAVPDVVDHICACTMGVCVNPMHLQAISRSQNNSAPFIDGTRSMEGEQNPNARLGVEDVLQIRRYVQTDAHCALVYNVTRQCISSLRKLPASANAHWKNAWPSRVPETRPKKTRFEAMLERLSPRLKLHALEDEVALRVFEHLAVKMDEPMETLNGNQGAVDACQRLFGTGSAANGKSTYTMQVISRAIRRRSNSNAGASDVHSSGRQWTAPMFERCIAALAATEKDMIARLYIKQL